MADWRGISEEMAVASPIVIGGMPRSGTTALRHTLQRLPALRTRDEVSRETRIFVSPLAAVDLRSRRSERLRSFLLDDADVIDELGGTLQGLAPTGVRRLTLAVLVRGGYGDSMTTWRVGRGRHVVRVFFHAARRARAVERVVEKTPETELVADRVFDAFPRVRFVICVRDPVDVFASFRARVAGDPTQIDRGFGVGVDDFIARYARSAHATREAVGRGAMTVSYESLTSDPHGTLRAVCEFIDEPFDEAALLPPVEDDRHDSRKPNARGRLVARESQADRFVTADEAARIRDALGFGGPIPG